MATYLLKEMPLSRCTLADIYQHAKTQSNPTAHVVCQLGFVKNEIKIGKSTFVIPRWWLKFLDRFSSIDPKKKQSQTEAVVGKFDRSATLMLAAIRGHVQRKIFINNTTDRLNAAGIIQSAFLSYRRRCQIMRHQAKMNTHATLIQAVARVRRPRKLLMVSIHAATLIQAIVRAREPRKQFVGSLSAARLIQAAARARGQRNKQALIGLIAQRQAELSSILKRLGQDQQSSKTAADMQARPYSSLQRLDTSLAKEISKQQHWLDQHQRRQIPFIRLCWRAYQLKKLKLTLQIKQAHVKAFSHEDFDDTRIKILSIRELSALYCTYQKLPSEPPVHAAGNHFEIPLGPMAKPYKKGQLAQALICLSKKLPTTAQVSIAAGAASTRMLSTVATLTEELTHLPDGTLQTPISLLRGNSFFAPKTPSATHVAAAPQPKLNTPSSDPVDVDGWTTLGFGGTK